MQKEKKKRKMLEKEKRQVIQVFMEKQLQHIGFFHVPFVILYFQMN